MNKLKFIVSLLLALGLVACPDDEDEKDDAKYSLKVAKPSSPAVGADFTVDVKLYKGDAIVKDDDAKNAKDAKVTGSIKCKEGEKVTATDGKFDAAGKASLTIKIADNSDKATTDKTGYTDCVVSASTEFGDDKTKASGDSDKFGVAAKTAGEVEPPTELTIAVTEEGEVTVSNAESSQKIELVKAEGTACEAAQLISWSSDNAVTEQPNGGFAHNATGLWIVGISGTGNTCKITVGDEEKTLASTDYSMPNKITGADVDAANEIDLTIVNPHGLTGKFTIVAESSGDDIVIEVANATTIPNEDTYTARKPTSFVASGTAYTVWIRHSGGIEKESVDA